LAALPLIALAVAIDRFWSLRITILQRSGRKPKSLHCVVKLRRLLKQSKR
jgi:hypothetical protein